MISKKKSSYKHSNYKVLTRNKSFVTSVVALMLLILGGGSALALSEMSQDTRGNAATLVRETDRFKSGMLNKPDSQSKTDAEKKAEVAQKKDADAESAKKAALEAKDKVKADAEKKAEMAAIKDAEAKNARIAAEKAKSAAQQDEKSGTRVAPPTQEDKRGTPANPEAPAKTIVTHTPTPSIPQKIVAAAKSALGNLLGDNNDSDDTDNPGSTDGYGYDDNPVAGGQGGGDDGGRGLQQQAASQFVFPNATAPLELVLVEQSKWINDKYKTRLVTKLSTPDSTLTGSKVVGEIYKGTGSNRKVLHECYIAIWDDYMLATTDSTDKPTNWCTNSPSEVYKGVIGQVSSRQTETNGQLLKECFDETNLNHFYVGSAEGCKAYAAEVPGKPTVRDSWTYGYIH